MTNGVLPTTQPALADDPVRARAIDPERSCIVQAPAGSGKTTLLAKRFVALLAGVQQPEQILAITFTKKAATEMRQRVLSELADETSLLGLAAMSRSEEKNWRLEQYPSRLRIQTIDAFAMSLVKQLPVTSKLQQRDITDHPEECYQRAVARVLQSIAETSDQTASERATISPIAASLLHDFDSNTQQVQNLLVTMLKRREQWLFSLSDHLSDFNEDRLIAAISQGIAELQRDALGGLLATVSQPTRQRLQYFARYAVDCLGEKPSFDDLPEFEQWRFIATNLVHKADSSLAKIGIRKRLNKKNGFPPTKDNTNKAALEALLAEFAVDERCADMLQSLAAIRDIPRLDAANRDRDRLAIIGGMLFNCVFELNNLFDERGQVDYNQITIAAITALGAAEAPTELALSLDYRISHLLIDEFQDTSRSQHMLFERLINEWTPSDNNTFFAVGDPMQSIYRFRNAEVSLFLEVCQRGIGNLPLEHLQLTTNFRSTDTMISWFNQVFHRVLGTSNNTNLGRISYAQATSPRGDLTPLTKTELSAPMQLSETVPEQLEQLVKHIQGLVDEQGSALTDIAILVRNRTPVGPLVRALETAGIAWQGTELHALAQTAIVSDLVVLANALFDPADHTSAFALLRSPLVGLTLTDLFAVAQRFTPKTTTQMTSVFNLLSANDSLTPIESLPGLSQTGHARLSRLCAAAQGPINKRLQLAPRELVETIWLQLGGPAAYPPAQLKHAERLLDTIEQGHPIQFSPQQLQQDIQKLYAEDDGAGVQILTVHKSKGLQYKHVLLPHLEAGTRADDSSLILQRASASGALLACKAPASSEPASKNDKTLYGWLKLEDDQRARNETRRVLYVAATRAETSLRLFATVASGAKLQGSNSLLTCLSEVFGELWEERLQQQAPAGADQPTATQNDNTDATTVSVLALPPSLQLPALPAPDVLLPARSRNIGGRRELDEPELLFALERRAAILRGNLTHEALCALTRDLADSAIEKIDRQMCEQVVSSLINNESHAWEQRARLLGLNPQETGLLAATVADQLMQTARSGLGRWCALQPQTDSQTEIGLTLWENSGPLSLVVDRMFVHKGPTGSNERWIIDYKTASPDSTFTLPHQSGASNWLTSEIERYCKQLARYARAVRAIHPDLPIRTALYFTATDELWETGLGADAELLAETRAIVLEDGTRAQNIALHTIAGQGPQ